MSMPGWMILLGVFNLAIGLMLGTWWNVPIAVVCFMLPFTKAAKS